MAQSGASCHPDLTYFPQESKQKWVRCSFHWNDSMRPGLTCCGWNVPLLGLKRRNFLIRWNFQVHEHMWKGSVFNVNRFAANVTRLCPNEAPTSLQQGDPVWERLRVLVQLCSGVISTQRVSVCLPLLKLVMVITTLVLRWRTWRTVTVARGGLARLLSLFIFCSYATQSALSQMCAAIQLPAVLCVRLQSLLATGLARQDKAQIVTWLHIVICFHSLWQLWIHEWTHSNL